jgi:hypothetical protein
LIQLAQDAVSLGVNTVGINPNIHPGYPEDSAPRLKEKIKEWGIPFPYLIDESQDTARAFQAQCTPDLYLFDSSRKLVYHGRLDDNCAPKDASAVVLAEKEESKVSRQELKEAVQNLASGKPISDKQIPSMGCSIKWRNE